MIDVDKAVIAKLKISGTNLEILVDCDKALGLKSGKDIDIRDIVASEKIFFDAKKGMLASTDKIKEIFETDDFFEIAKKIIAKGDVQETAEHKNKKLEEKKKVILQSIHTNCIDPKTKNPIPVTRLELAFEEAKVRIVEHKSNEEQMKEIVKKLSAILPIKIELAKVNIVVPANYAAKGYPVVKKLGTITGEDWRNDGSWACKAELPAGLKNDLIDSLNSLTKGEVEIQFLD